MSPVAPPALLARDIEWLQGLLRDACSVVLGDDQGYLLESRLFGLLRKHDLDSIHALVERLRAGEPELERETTEALLNGETTFFRDVACFDALERVVLPRLMAARPNKRLTLWSAACSTGQEPYSLAMLLVRAFPQLEDWSVQILATDFSEKHLARARAGRYAQHEVNRGLPAASLVRHFEKDGEAWVIEPSIRDRVEFRQMSLTKPWSFVPAPDLVLLRNVMIYWDLETKREVLARVRQLLRPDGVLVLGGAETTYHVDPAFEPLAETRCCFVLADAESGRPVTT